MIDAHIVEGIDVHRQRNTFNQPRTRRRGNDIHDRTLVDTNRITDFPYTFVPGRIAREQWIPQAKRLIK
jgi:hypothetical protein